MSYAETLEKELQDLPEGWIALIETDAEKSTDVGVAAIKIMTSGSYTGIVISASRPCRNLLDMYEKKGVARSKVFLLDTVCKGMMANPPEADNVVHVEGSTALTEISLATSEAIKMIEGKKFLFIDSITTMLVHNKPEIFARFIHSTLTKIRISGISGIMISIEEETDKTVRSEIAQLCDKVIRV
ncbi:MAG: hypothetical protein HYS81_01525 [Candidatus Aenigmatarchaeota archaeon]|nr:MAG: hypothetical protein HYS81_01525 [Candidatus Aenigmarchaeota archaeon]